VDKVVALDRGFSEEKQVLALMIEKIIMRW